MRKITATLSILVLLSMLVGVAWAQAPDDIHVDLTLDTAPPPVAAAPGGESVPYTGSPDALLDDFNRADGPLGPNWGSIAGSCSIVSQAARCSYGVSTWIGGGGGDGSTAEVDVQTNGTSLQYTGLVLHAAAGIPYPFLKVQDQSNDGKFEYAACYLGNNSEFGSFGLGFFALDQAFASAHMKATQSGTTVTIEFTNVEGGTLPDQTYVCDGAPAPAASAAGIHGYAMYAQVDNYAVGGGGPKMFVQQILMLPFEPQPGLRLVIGGFRIWDETNMPVGGATVDADWTIPPSPFTYPRTGVTNPNGVALQWVPGPWSGTYGVCVTNVTAAGFVYDENMNVVTCGTINLP